VDNLYAQRTQLVLVYIIIIDMDDVVCADQRDVS
jgi:hypothetical protein